MGTMDDLKKIRKERKMTQAALAEKSGLALSSIQRYERGERVPNIDTLDRIAAALDVQIMHHSFQQKFHQKRKSEAGRPDILSVYNSLNTAGQDKVIDYAADLATMPKYQAAPPEDPEE